MERHTLLQHTCDAVRFRLMRGSGGYVVIKSTPKPSVESVSIERWRFAPDAGDLAAACLLAEVMAHLGTASDTRLAASQAAVGRVANAQRTMRAGCGALRQIQAAAMTTAQHYVTEGHRSIEECLELERRLVAAGFRPPVLAMPAWMDALLDDPEHQLDPSSLDLTETPAPEPIRGTATS